MTDKQLTERFFKSDEGIVLVHDTNDYVRLATVLEILLVAEIRVLREENSLLRECDCMPALVSSKSCHKCGRRGTVPYETFLDLLRAANERDKALAQVKALREELQDVKKESNEWFQKMKEVRDERDLLAFRLDVLSMQIKVLQDGTNMEEK